MLAVFVLGVVLRLPTFGRAMLSDDEAIYATTADALSRGDLLYRDVVDHKPPAIYHVYRAGFALFGAYQTHGAHLFVVVAVLVTAAFLFFIRRDASAGRGGALAAAGLFLIFSTTWHDYDALAANCELFLLAPQAAAAWLLLRDLRAPSPAPGLRGWALHLTVGILIGASGLFKVQGLTFLGASVGLLMWKAHLARGAAGGAPWSWVATRALGQLVGASLPPALYLGWCAVAGSADAALFWFRFNFSYVGAGLSGLEALARGLRRTALIGGAALVPYALGLAAAVTTGRALVRALRSRPPAAAGPSVVDVLGLLWLVTSAVAVSAGGRFFGHYFHLVLPPLCLLAAPTASAVAARRDRRAVLAVLCGVPALAFFALATFARPLTAVVDETQPRYDDVATRIAALSAGDERVFIWGNSPQLYLLARRPMGARFSFCNYMTGESPGTPTETGRRDADANQLAVAWTMLFSDLEQRRPVLFVDAAAAGWDGYDKYPVTRYPALRTYLDRHYRPVETVSGVVIHRRRPDSK